MRSTLYQRTGGFAQDGLAHGFGAGGYAACPMRCRRSAEIAAGDLHTVLDEALSTSFVDVLGSCAGLEQRDRARVTEDMQHAKEKLQYSLQLKLAPTQQLPFLLAGLTHHDIQKARACAQKALDVFRPEDRHHRLSAQVLSVGSPIRPQVQAFAVGNESFDAFPDLFMTLAPLKFIPLAEPFSGAPSRYGEACLVESTTPRL